MTVRKYTSRSQQTTITSAITSGASSMTVASASAILGGIAPSSITGGVTFTLVIDPDTALEEILDVTGASSSTFTISRGIDGSSPQDHSAGAVVRHMLIGRDVREPNTHAETGTGVHGLASTSVVVGTFDTQTLLNKTLTSPTISGSPTITGLGTPSASSDAAPKSYVDGLITTNQSYATAAATSASSAATSASSAVTSATSSASSASAALSSANSAATSATAAATSATSAAASATAAATSAASSAASTSAAAASATAAATSATSAAASATAAATSATSAATQATAAATSASSAATQATAAATSATSAAASATTAANSVATISSYATAAATSANSAATSATAAATSATSAAASATAASTSATSASNSLTSITGLTGAGIVRDMGSITDADTTTTSYINISTLTSQAQTSATSAATSASSALTSQTAAATSATSAAASATAAATSATSAAASATAAATSAASAAAAVTSAVPLSGGTMTGFLTLSADPTSNLHAVTKQYADAITAAINFHAPVARATTANLTGTYNNGSSSGVGATFTVTATGRLALDGGNVNTNDRVLLKNQTTDLQNGIYVVTNQGSAGVSAVLTRATDYDNNVEVSNGDILFCTLGTQNAGVTFVNTSTNPVTIGTSSIIFSVYTSASLPTQTGNAGKYLTTDGTTPSWASVTTDPKPDIFMMMGA